MTQVVTEAYVIGHSSAQFLRLAHLKREKQQDQTERNKKSTE